jgi:hypothetical protein
LAVVVSEKAFVKGFKVSYVLVLTSAMAKLDEKALGAEAVKAAAGTKAPNAKAAVKLFIVASYRSSKSGSKWSSYFV